MKKIVLSSSSKKSSNTSKEFGTVYIHNNHVYRTIEDKYKEQVENFISNKPLMDKLKQSGLIETTVAPIITEQYAFILEHKLIDFNSYMDEWSLPAKKDATLMVITLLEELIKTGWCLWDGHPYNVLFNFTEPLWIDFHSILPFTLTTAWWNEFKYYFINNFGDTTSLLWEEGIESLYKDSENHKENALVFLDKIKISISAIKIDPKKTPWFDYPRLDDIKLDAKQVSTLKVMEKIKPYCNTFLDIGCNVGWYSKAASQMGYKVVATDVDEACIAELYIESKKNGDSILPLVTDFKTCLDNTSENYESFANRLSCDATLSLALLHHLVFFQECDFQFIAERLNRLSKKYAVVQFITRNDSYIKHWLNTATKDYTWYTMNNFISEMKNYFSSYEIFDSFPVGRKLLLFKR